MPDFIKDEQGHLEELKKIVQMRKSDNVLISDYVVNDKPKITDQKNDHYIEKMKKRIEKQQYHDEIEKRKKDIFNVDSFLSHMTNPDKYVI